MVSGRPYRGIIAAFLAPAVIVYTVFLIAPIADSLRLSLYAQPTGEAASFVGLGNYAALFGDPNWSVQFWRALGNNVVFFCIHMLVQNPVGLALAGMLSARVLAGRGFYRTVFFMPTMLS